MASTLIEHLVYEWRGIIIFGASDIEVVVINPNMDGALFFVKGNGV